ncbi:hypothetical protein [Anaerobiospirillum succiniciproducens]|uniref:hypothetical protein n=1 Tax=Anaerobiospirillum succiniciproducens TaxID=13335 RepID=UPI0004158173|nr:hypothetical protein [Anaerobiospirillum succiniciproducens]
MFGHQIKDIEDKTLESSKTANVEQSIHEHVQFDAVQMDAKDDGCLVAVAHDEAKDSVLDHKLPVAACVADSQTKPSCDALAAAHALSFVQDPDVVSADDAVDAAVPSQVLSAGFFATELNCSMESIELIDALAADDDSVLVVDVSACLSDIASAKLCFDVRLSDNDEASDISDAKSKLAQEWLNHSEAEISKVMMPKCSETIWNTTQHDVNTCDDAFGVGVASLTSLALDDRAVGLDISTLLSTQEPCAGAADTQNTYAQSLEGTCLSSDATTLATSNALRSSDDSTAAEDDAYAYSDADADICGADDALALVEVDSIHLSDGDGVASNNGCDEPVAHAVGECDTLVAMAANEANAANAINVANVAANESEILSDGAAVTLVQAASDAVSSFGSSAAVGGSADAGADTDAVEVDCCGVALDVVAAALSHASHEGSDICGLSINGCAKIWSESNSYFFERGSNLDSLETMSVGERLDYLLDSFSYEIDPYSIKALDSAIALVNNRRSMMRSCEESNYVLLKNLGLSDVEIQDLLSVLHLEENYSTGAYLLGVCDDELEFKEALKPYSLDTLITDPEFEKAMLDKLLLWNKADERQLNKNARLQTTINKIYSAMDRRCGGRFKLRDQRFIAEMAIIFLSFAHDISKIRTDLDIRAANGLKYEPYQSLTDFIAETKTPYLLLRHLLGRKDDHHKIGLSYGVDMLARYCYNTEKLVSQLFDIRMEINDFSSPLAEIVIKKGDRGSCCTAATTLSSNAEMLRVMAKESAAMRLRISQLNAILQADIEDNVNLLRDRTFERLIKANPIPELQLNSVADLSTENGTAASLVDGIQGSANSVSTPSGANASDDASSLDASESKNFTAAAGDGDADEAKSQDSSSECLDDGACADAHADTHDDTGADAISDTDSGADEAVDGNCVLHAPKSFSCLKEMERRQRYGNCLFTNLNKEPQRTICTLSSLMYASALAEYERRIHSVNETYSDIYVSDNTMYISTSSRAHASLLFGMNLLTYQDLQTSLEWDGKLVHEIIVRNGLSFRRGHNYHLTECEGNTVIFRGFTLRVDEQPIYPQLKVRQLANNDTLLNQLVGSIALYIAARHEQQNYLIEHRKMLLRIFELMAALSRRERVRLLARLDDVSYERYKLLERSLNIFESISLVSTQKIAASLHANDPLAKAIEQGPQHMLELMRKYPVDDQCTIDSMAGNASLNSFGSATTAADTNTANLSSNAANASASASASASNAANAANSANRANGDGATGSMVDAIEQGCGDAGRLKSAWFELINEYEQRCMGVDIPALVQAFNLDRKSIAVNSTEAVVFREVLGLGVAIMIGASHADDDIFKASKRHVVTGGFDYRNMKMRGLRLIELENSHLKDFDPLNLPNYMDYELKPSRMVINGCTLSDVLHSAEHYKQQVTVTFENGSKALNDVLCSRQSKAKKLKKQLEQCPV